MNKTRCHGHAKQPKDYNLPHISQRALPCALNCRHFIISQDTGLFLLIPFLLRLNMAQQSNKCETAGRTLIKLGLYINFCISDVYRAMIEGLVWWIDC